jgi:hypothetical protein
MKAVVVEGTGGVTVAAGDTTTVTVQAGASDAVPKAVETKTAAVEATTSAPVPAPQQITIGKGKFPLLDHIQAKLAMLG